MYNRIRDRYQAIMAVGRQFTHLVHAKGSVEGGLDALKQIGQDEQHAIINGLDKAFRENINIDNSDVKKRIGPYGVLQRLIALIKQEGGDPVAVFPYFDKMLNAVDEQTRALWVSISGFLVYMTSVLMVAGIVFTILMIFVLPQFQAMFEGFGADLPSLTNWVTRNNATIFYATLLAFGLLVFVLMMTVLHVFDVSGRLVPLSLTLRHIPFLRNVINTYNRLLSLNYTRLLLSAGLSTTRAIEIASELANDVALMALAKDSPISSHRRDRALHAIAIAKQADNLESELEYHINDQNYQLASDFTHARQKALFALHLLLAFFVGLFVIAMYLPIFKMGEVG